MSNYTCTAQRVKALLDGSDAAAYSLSCGYAVLRDGSRQHFEQGSTLADRRDPSGRCLKTLAEYKDKSRLEFRWSDSAGSSLKVIKAVQS